MPDGSLGEDVKQWRRNEEERRRIEQLDFDWVKEAKLGE